MFGKSSQWWFGKNSIFGQAIRQTKYGAGNPTDLFGGQGGSGNEAELLKYGMIGLFVYLIVIRK
jgi:hypothetical protein